MARSLARNTRVFASTLNMTPGDPAEFIAANITAENTMEIKVLDGYSFSQDVASQEIGVNEADSECAGAGLARGTLSFNTALNPVDVSFSTYVRPYGDGTYGNCVERLLWSSAMGTLTGFTNSPTLAADPAADATFAQQPTFIKFGLNTSNSNNLMPLTLFFVLENTTYVVEQFNVGSAEVDFSIDGIATINWSGNGSRVNENFAAHALLKHPGGTLTKVLDPTDATAQQYLGVPETTTTTFLRNRLSTLDLISEEKNEVVVSINGNNEILSVTTTVITLDAATLTLAAHDDTVIYNVTQNEWAGIASNTTTAITCTEDVANLGWSESDNYEIYGMLNIDEGTVDVTAKTITAGGALMTAGAYANGRVARIEADGKISTLSAIILDNTTTAITLAEAMPTGWDTGSNDFIIYTTAEHAPITYCIPITGATLTLENNITYLTPEELAIVNLPLAGYAGNRVTSGSLTAYLNTGSTGSGGLLGDLLAKIEDSVNTDYHITFHMGGNSTATTRVDFDMKHASISVPSTNVEDIISTEITFSAKPWDETNDVASFEDTNELTIAYIVPAP